MDHLLSSQAVEELGFSATRLERIRRVLETDVEKQAIPGSVLLVAREGTIAYLEAFGFQNRARGIPMSVESIFPLASASKTITALAVMILWEEGHFDLNDPVFLYLPELSNLHVAIVQESPGDKEEVTLVAPGHQPTIHELLTLTAGFTLPDYLNNHVAKLYREAGIGTPSDSLADMVVKLGHLPLLCHPGRTYHYGSSFAVLGRLVEQVSGQSLDHFIEDRICKPLGLKDTGFFVHPSEIERIADADLGQADTNSHVLAAPRFLDPAGGLFSTARESAAVLQMFLNGGKYGTTRILSPKTVAYMSSNQVDLKPQFQLERPPRYRYIFPEPGYGVGIGFVVRMSLGIATWPGSVGSYYWLGRNGQLLLVDPDEKLVIVYLAHGTLDMWTKSPLMHSPQQIPSLVYQALTK